MDKFLDFVMHPGFILGAIVGAVAAFAAQVFLIGDMPFFWFWVLNALAALAGGSILRALR